MKTSLPKFLIAALLMGFAGPAFGESGWLTNYNKAVEEAQANDKAILLDFTGSDWCEWCMKMKQETLDTSAFKSYAEKNLVLVEVDFPNHKPQSATVKAQNQQLKQKYGVSGFPSLVILDKDGKELGRQGGYLAGGPSAFIAELKKFYKGSPNAGAGGGAAAGDDFDSFFKKPAGSPTP